MFAYQIMTSCFLRFCDHTDAMHLWEFIDLNIYKSLL